MYNQHKHVFSSMTYLLLSGGPGPRHALPSVLLHPLSPLLVRRPMWIGASGPRLQDGFALAQPAAVQPLNQPKEDSLPRVPGEQSVDQSTSRSHDLARHLDHRRAKRRELHPQQRLLLSLVLGRVPRRYRYQQGAPSFQAPRQRGHYHVRPVADQVVHWRGQCMYSALELGDQVLLIAPVIRREHDLFGRGVAVVGDIEEIAILLEQPQLRLVNPQQLADDDYPITSTAGSRPIVELGDHLLEHVNRLEPPLSDDLLLDPFGLLAGRGLDFIPRRSLQEAIRPSREFVGSGFESLVVVEPEDEADIACLIPAVQVLGLGEIRVAPQGDPPKASPTAQVDRLVEVDGGLLVRGTVTAAIDQVERFGSVGQRDQQWMIAPGAVVGDIDTLLALGVGPDDGAIDVQDRFLEEIAGLIGPDPQPRFVDGLHQG